MKHKLTSSSENLFFKVPWASLEIKRIHRKYRVGDMQNNLFL